MRNKIIEDAIYRFEREAPRTSCGENQLEYIERMKRTFESVDKRMHQLEIVKSEAVRLFEAEDFNACCSVRSGLKKIFQKMNEY